jgi:mannose-6-phosphate isomerase
MSVRQIPPKFVPKVWGSTVLEPWFPNPTERIGEVWFPAGDLLIKFLFTSEDLSVQVHPDDEYAARHENSRGKTEMWYILQTDGDARIAVGFREPVSADRLRKSMETGSIMDDLAWHRAKPGDTFFTPAGTVHAIGAGLALCEIQQNSDVTYRMFDYGRPRELHLDRAVDVADFGTHPGANQPQPVGPGHDLLVRSKYFVTERLNLSKPAKLPGGSFAIILEGRGRLDGVDVQPGAVWEISEPGSEIEPSGSLLLLTTSSRV